MNSKMRPDDVHDLFGRDTHFVVTDHRDTLVRRKPFSGLYWMKIASSGFKTVHPAPLGTLKSRLAVGRGCLSRPDTP